MNRTTRTSSGVVAVAAFAAVALAGGPSGADVREPPRVRDVAPSPPPGCTASEQQGPAEECVVCAASAENRTRCEGLLDGYGFRKRCRSSGRLWNEIWCRPKRDARPLPSDLAGILGDPSASVPVPAEPEDGGGETPAAVVEPVTPEPPGPAEPVTVVPPEAAPPAPESPAAAVPSAGAKPAAPAPSSKSSGCGCAVPARPPVGSGGLPVVVLLGALAFRRRGRSR